jgi:hypothetical protein
MLSSIFGIQKFFSFAARAITIEAPPFAKFLPSQRDLRVRLPVTDTQFVPIQNVSAGDESHRAALPQLKQIWFAGMVEIRCGGIHRRAEIL